MRIFTPYRFALFVIYLLLGSLCISGGSALAQEALTQERGAALFAIGAPQFPCDQALKIFEPGGKITSLAILWGTFGNDTRCLVKWADKMKLQGVKHVLEIHLTNETCRRTNNRKCTSDELYPKLSVSKLNRALEMRQPEVIQEIVSRITEIKALTDTFDSKELELVLSTGLEDNYSFGAYSAVLETVRAHWPHKVVRNPVGALMDKSQLTADYLEIHGASPDLSAPCIANLDGEDIVFPHRRSPLAQRVGWDEVLQYVKEYQSRCRVTFLWSSPWQGIYSEAFVEPTARKFEVSDKDISAIRAIP